MARKMVQYKHKINIRLGKERNQNNRPNLLFGDTQSKNLEYNKLAFLNFIWGDRLETIKREKLCNPKHLGGLSLHKLD